MVGLLKERNEYFKKLKFVENLCIEHLRNDHENSFAIQVLNVLGSSEECIKEIIKQETTERAPSFSKCDKNFDGSGCESEASCSSRQGSTPRSQPFHSYKTKEKWSLSEGSHSKPFVLGEDSFVEEREETRLFHQNLLELRGPKCDREGKKREILSSVQADSLLEGCSSRRVSEMEEGRSGKRVASLLQGSGKSNLKEGITNGRQDIDYLGSRRSEGKEQRELASDGNMKRGTQERFSQVFLENLLPSKVNQEQLEGFDSFGSSSKQSAGIEDAKDHCGEMPEDSF